MTTSTATRLAMDNSPLLRRAIAVNRFHVKDYMGDGEYPYARAEKDEAEARVAWFTNALQTGDVPVDGLDAYMRAMFRPDTIASSRENGQLLRLVGFAALQRAVDEALDMLELGSLNAPRGDAPVFAAHPALFEALDPRDRLLRLTSDMVGDERLGDEALAAWEGDALFPHPLLAPMRELVWELRDLAASTDLIVSVALNPFRSTPVEEIQHRLLEDFWSGIKLTPENLDSLDRHDVGTPSFHAVVDRSPAHEFFFPLLGTWFDWSARRDDPSDTVKRLYIREVCPAEDRHGDALAAVVNRELHTERDTSARCFTHIDGKVRRYPANSYGPSRSNPRASFGPHTHSRKLWRVDGALTDKQWCQLAGLYFRQNELIEEHFKEAFPMFPRT